MQQIRYFLSLAETLNFTRAAEECNVSQPSLTRAIRLLEAELGGELLRRERRQSHLTDLGERMLPLMRQCYESALSAKKLARSLKTNEIAPLTIALSDTINLALLLPYIDELSAAYPGIQLKIRRGDGEEVNRLLKDGDAELAVAGPLVEMWERLDRWEVHEERFDILANRGHKLAESGEVQPGKLKGERFLMRTGCEVADDLARQLGEHGVDLANPHEVDSDADLAALLEANFGIAVCPASAPQSALVVRVPVTGLDLRRKIAVYGIAGRRRSAAATALLNLLRAADWSRAVN